MNRVVRVLALAGATAGGMALLATPAAAHVTPDKDEVPAGSFNSVTLTVGHGCEESPTREVAVEIPEGVGNVAPQVKPGWTVAPVVETLEQPIDDGEGGQITERTAQVVFTANPGNELPDGFRDTFTIGFRTPETPGEWLFFKTVQRCVAGETGWIDEYTGEGEEPEHPSPAMLIGEPEGEHGGGSDEAAEATAEEDSASPDGEEAAADSDDDESDSSNGLAIAALVVGAVGVATGGFALARTRKAS